MPERHAPDVPGKDEMAEEHEHAAHTAPYIERADVHHRLDERLALHPVEPLDRAADRHGDDIDEAADHAEPEMHRHAKSPGLLAGRGRQKRVDATPDREGHETIHGKMGMPDREARQVPDLLER